MKLKTKAFDMREALAWKACTWLVEVCTSISNSAMRRISSTVLNQSRKLDDCYTKPLIYVLYFKWSDHVSNNALHNRLDRVSIRLLEKQLRFAGHCTRNKQPISELLIWDHTEIVRSNCAKGASCATNSRQLLRAIGKVDGMVSIGKFMLYREAWRSRISMIVHW
jgi:hypothetical protein